ncbi:hypothetical protein SAMN04515674_104284 [Pseudarcicella hirudinis]|uniref:Uncharacterized protein n=1 Tax=Pseudarcicella hirudinis TaxID=1079859 RepID=A0A1I5RWW9_9BACT|nr:hypothetical protein [Pseudarcicella hirudinis]SFP62887.1 hypothetical protein SAMN04515674_104284 [Pseudarcicella hirudinis]
MVNIGIISQVSALDRSALLKIRDALNIQADQLMKINGYEGHYEIFDSVSSMPDNYYPMYIKSEIDQAELNGYHWVDEQNKPYIDVRYNSDFDALTLTMSHEGIETIANPRVDKFLKADNFLNEPNLEGQFFFEIADITQSKEFAYRINGVLVSNFVTNNWYDAAKIPGQKYDYLGYCTEPRQLLEGGYKSLKVTDKRNPSLVEYWQAFKQKGVIVWKKLNGKDVALTAISNPFPWIIVALSAVFIFLFLIFRKKS